MTTFLDPNDARLTAYALGELDDNERSEVERLLAASPEMRSEFAEITNLVATLKVDLANEPVPSLTDSQRQELIAPQGVSATTVRPTSRVGGWRNRLVLLTGSTVMVASLVGVMAFVSSMNTATHTRGTALSNAPVSETLGYRFDTSSDTDSLNLIGQNGESSAQTLNGASFLEGSGPIRARFYAGSNAGNTTLSRNGHDGIHDGSNFQVQNGAIVGLSGTFDANKSDNSKQPLFPHEQAPSEPASTQPAASVQGRRLSGANNLGDISLKEDSIKPGLGVTHQPEAPKNSAFAGRKLSAESEDVQKQAVASLDVFRDDAYALIGTEKYDRINENAFLIPSQCPLSTFSIDVDSASYTNIRRFLTQGQLPPPAAVRIEEMINYFNYSYPQPKEGEPFSVTADAAACPWQRDHYLARIALQARTIDKARRPPTNLVFLLDVSGSMQAANKLPLVKQAMTMLCEELNERDRIAIVTYAGEAGLKLPSTYGSDQVRVMQAIESLQAGGSTNGAAGINVAYEETLKNFNREGENRVILCTDGDFNVGVSDDEQLVQLIQQQAKSKVFLSIFGFGMGNLKDAKLEKLADKGNGHYGYIDDLKEARRVFSEELVGTLYTVAKDVKIQVEFNPLTVGSYRLIGYENRALAAKDFNDDTKDAGEIGAGHTVTALYEIVPRTVPSKTAPVEPLKYASVEKESATVVDVPKGNIPPDAADDLFTVKLRYKQPTADTSVRTIDYVVDDIAGKKITPSSDFLWAASVASFGMHLRHSQFAGQWTLNDILETAQAAKGPDANGRRREFLDLIQTVRRLK